MIGVLGREKVGCTRLFFWTTNQLLNHRHKLSSFECLSYLRLVPFFSESFHRPKTDLKFLPQPAELQDCASFSSFLIFKKLVSYLQFVLFSSVLML